ncbi:MAG: hypothetical protein IKT98_05700, partial [Selenomonadaceae bacterium]|nr:hypothetical protein [Selenomonadaceae bacterium]
MRNKIFVIKDFQFDLQRFDADTWDGTATSVPDAVDNVITITTAEQLAALAAAVNDGTDYSGITIKLDADLDLSGYNWTPIGNYNYNYNYNNSNYNKFKGTFDGQGHTISGLTYQTYSHNNYVGLFGLVDTGGTVQNVTLINVNIWGNAERVGGIAGDNHGTIQNCSVSGTINGYINLGGIVGWNHTGSITNCTFSGTVNCNSYNAGGIAGYSYDGSIKDCVTNAQVSGGESPVGGVVGSVVKGYAGTDTNPNYYSGNLNPIGKISDTTDVVNKSLYQITMPDGVTVDGAINLGGTDYVKEGGTLTISGFSTGEISFGDKVASFTQSSNTFTAKDSAGNELFTVSTTAAVSENSWTVNGGSATYSQGFTTAGAIMNGDKLKYQDVASDSFTINGIKDGTTTEQLETAIDISVDKKVTVKDASVLSGSVSLNNSNYTLDFAESLKCREYSVGFNDMGGGVYKYFNTEGGRSGWKETNGTWTFQTATEPEPAAVLTLSGLAKAPTVNDGVITLGEDNFTGNAITATGNITDFKYAFTVSGKTFNGVKTISGLTYNAAGYYEIADAQDLKDLATYVNAGNNCAGLTFKLTEDISGVDFHIGTFSGTLDGDSHKITVSYDVTTNNRALFNYVDGATIQKLTVDGTINTSAAYAAGLVAKVIGGVTYITDCISSVTINSTFNGYAGHGGFVAYVNSGTLNFTNCIFNGSLLGKDTNNCGGFVGYSDGTVNITNSLFAPTEVTIGTNNSSTFARGNTPNLSGGGYYLQTFGNNQGTQVYKITLPDGATSDDAVNLGGTYYAKEGGTVTISDFNGGEISFGSEVASLTKDGNNFTAKDSAGNTLFTVNTTAAVATGGWEISGNNATYSQGFSAGAIIDGAKLSYQAAKTDSFTISGIKDDTTTEKLQAAIDISADKKVTVNDDSVLSGNVSLNNSNYTLDFADNLKYFEVVKGFKDMGGGVYKYFDASGNCAGWENNNGTWTFQNGTDPEPKAVLTLSGLAKAPTVSDGIITLGAEDFSGDEITADDNNSNFKYAFTVSGKTFNGVKTISGLTYNAADGGYYEISSIDDLQTLATYVNAGNKCEGLTFKVTATIDLSEITNFTPIGNFSNRFKGTFDGQGNTISGLTISGLTSNGDWEVGLFDYVDTGGTVKDVTLINVNVTGDEKVGAVVGVNYGTVTGCKVSGSVNGTSSESTYIGGVVGVNYGTVTGCFTDVNITVGRGGSFGAIVGKNDTVPGANVTLGTAEKPNYYSYGEPIGANYVSGGVNKLLYEITLPNGATADGAVNLGDKYYAKEGGTVTISDFSAGKILFGDKVASFAQSGNNFTAKDAYGNDLFTVNTTAAVIENSWTVNAGSATYSKGFTTAGAIVDGAKLSYQAAENNSFTINGIASGKTADDLRGAISVSEDNKVTVNNASVLSDNDVYLQEGSNYTLDFADNLKYFEVVKGFKDMGGGVYKYFDTEGGRAGWENNNSTWTYHDATEPETVLTLNGLAKAPTVSDGVITLGAEDFSGDEITADDNNSNFKYAFTVSGKTFNGVPTISGLTYNAAGGYYEIADAQDLNDLATYVNAGNNCDGLTFKLTADISGVDFHIGDTEDHKFKGTFDGDDHKITVSYTETAIDDKHPCALFNFVDGATIKKLAVDGNITTSAKYAAGLVAKVIGGVTYITDCTSSVTINSSVGGDGTHGGFVGGNSGTLNFTNCIFDGSLLGSSTDSCAGFVGYSGDGTVNITNSLFAPTEVTIGTYRSATFARSSSGDYSGSGDSYSGGYYTKAFGATQSGTQVYKITLPAGATSDDAVNLGGTYYVKEGGTLTISDFRSGEISFGSEVASLTQSGNNFTAKDSAGNVLFTVSTTAAVGDSSWSVSGTEATYSQGFTTAGAIIDGAKLKYQAVAIDDSLTINGIASGTTTEQLNAAISVSDDKKVTVNNASVLSGSVSLNNSNYTLDFADNLKYREVVEGFNDMGGGVYKYFDASGNLAGWKETNGTWNYQNATEPTAVLTLSGLANAPTVSDGVITLDESDFSGDEITATGTLTNFKYAFTVSGKTFNGVKTISGLTYNAADGGYYEISSVDDLRTLATYVNDGNNCDGLTFKLTADISGVDFHIGTFSGTFDGNNHKITVNYGTETARITTEGCALFNKLDNATVRGLTVDGTIYTSDKYAAGLAVHTENAVTIENCRSSVTINSTQSGDGTHSGFVGGVNSGTLNFTNCIFDGSLLGKDTNSCGGFVGYNGGGTVNITNSLFAPTEVTIGTTGSATFARGNAPTIDGGYYTKLFNDAQSGTQVYKITLPSGVTATGDTVVTFGNDIYAAGTVTISDFSSGEISFGSEVASLTKSGDTFTAKDADGNDLFTVNTTAAVGDSSWTTVNEGSATYNQSFTTAGAIINGAKLSYRAAENDSFTINGIASGTTTNQLNAAISVSDNKQVTVNDDSVLSGGTVSLNNSNYTLDFDRSLKYFEVVKGFNDMGGGVYKYFNESGNFTGWKETAGTWNYQTGTEPTAVLTLSGLANAPTVSDGVITLGESDFSGDAITAEGTLSNFKYAFTVTGKTFAGVPTINGLTYNAADGGYYEIADAQDLADLATYVNSGVNSGHNCEGLTFKVTAAIIDLSAITNFTPIGSDYDNRFNGTFDGQGNTISNLTSSNYNSFCGGLFGWVQKGCRIQNVTLTNVNVTGRDEIGGLVGKNYGSITNCTLSGTVSGTSLVGGLVGSNNHPSGTIENCTFSGTVSGTSLVGGLVGSNESTSGSITNCTFSGTVSGNQYVGGAVGHVKNSGGSVKNTTVDVQVTGTGDNIGAVIGCDNTYKSSDNKYHSNVEQGGTGSTRYFALDLPEGSTYPTDKITVNGKTYYVNGSTVTIDGNDYTIDGDNYYYVDENGKTKLTTATVLTSNATELDGGWYIVKGNVTIDEQLAFDGDTHLILADGATLTVNGEDDGINVNGTLNIYGQTLGTGNLDATGNYNGIVAANNGNINIYGGKIKATGNEGTGISAENAVNISGGQVTATGDHNGIYAGGAINLSWTKSTDFIDASSYSKTPAFAEGKRFYDESGNINPTSGKIYALDGYIITIPDGVNLDSGYIKRSGETNSYICAANAELTLSTGTNAAFEKITGIKDARADGNAYKYTVTEDKTLEPVGFLKIDGLTFVDGNSGEEYYEIADAQDIKDLAAYVSGGNDCTGYTFKLTADLDLTTETFTAISGFKGTFDGNGKLIVTDKAIFSGNTGTITDGYYYGTSIGAFTQTFKVNVPSTVTVTADDDDKTTFGGKTYYKKGAQVTIDGNDFTINADNYYYVDSDGKTKLTTATILDGTQTTLGGGNYIVLGNVTINYTLNISGNANLILADGAKLTVNVEGGDGINVNGTLNIYVQTLGTGNLDATGNYNGIVAANNGNINIYGGKIKATGNEGTGINAYNDVN